jgi:hypothetical protein
MTLETSMRVLTIPEEYLEKARIWVLFPWPKNGKFQEVSLPYMKILYKYGTLNVTRSTTVLELEE